MFKEESWLLKEKYGGVETEEFHADLKRLAAGKPLGYVIGFVNFLGCKIFLDSRPLIPRVETEFWVEKAITEIKNHRSRTSVVKEELKVLDLCAGSGAIGVAIARHIPEAQVTFAEIDRAHFPTIGKNLAENAIVCTNYKVFESDLFSNIHEKYNYIFCNPPYIDKDLDRTQKSVKEFEPSLALYGGRGGLEIIERIITASPTHLLPGGKLYLEHEPEQAAFIQTVGRQNGFAVKTELDQYQRARYSSLIY
jgi:release factor glutamine methyltransferase